MPFISFFGKWDLYWPYKPVMPLHFQATLDTQDAAVTKADLSSGLKWLRV